jgi:hypothetical protein
VERIAALVVVRFDVQNVVEIVDVNFETKAGSGKI